MNLGGQTVVFDTFNTQQAAEDLKKCAEELTNNEVSWVINSHYHGDHIRGNQVFESSTIVSSDTTYSKIRDIQPSRIESQKQDMDGLRDTIRELETTVQKTYDKNLDLQVRFLKEMEASLPTLTLTLPTETFRDEYTFRGSERSATLYTKGGGHSPCDSFLYLPDDKVIFMGDLLFVTTHPSFFEDSDIDNWIHTLQDLITWNIQLAIPGHGPIGTKHELRTLIHYINNMKKTALQAENLQEFPMPHQYQDWALPQLFHRNLQLLHQT